MGWIKARSAGSTIRHDLIDGRSATLDLPYLAVVVGLVAFVGLAVSNIVVVNRQSLQRGDKACPPYLTAARISKRIYVFRDSLLRSLEFHPYRALYFGIRAWLDVVKYQHVDAFVVHVNANRTGVLLDGFVGDLLFLDTQLARLSSNPIPKQGKGTVRSNLEVGCVTRDMPGFLARVALLFPDKPG